MNVSPLTNPKAGLAMLHDIAAGDFAGFFKVNVFIVSLLSFGCGGEDRLGQLAAL